MKWINPHDRLPEVGQLIWALIIENRQEENNGYPCAQATICKVSMDRYGVEYSQEISHKGFPDYNRYFFEWWHYDEHERQQLGIYKFYGHSDDIIVAWAPFEGLPQWSHINVEESKTIIMNRESYKKALIIRRAEKEAEKARGDVPYFIEVTKHLPHYEGVYVICNQEGVWLSRYEEKTCNPWIAPNGKPVTAWYPIPQHY